MGFVVALGSTVSFIDWGTRKYFDQKRLLTIGIIVSVFLSILIASILTSGLFYDVSYDGQTYHQEAVSQLNQGWNPVRDPPLQNEYGIWINHYPKAPWIYAAQLYKITGRMEPAKSTNVIIHQEPENFQHASRFKKLLTSIFCQTENVSRRETTKWKWPFSLDIPELAALTTPDSRIAGFDPWFGGAFLLSIFILLTSSASPSGEFSIKNRKTSRMSESGSSGCSGLRPKSGTAARRKEKSSFSPD